MGEQGRQARQERGEATRSALLDVALELFAGRGFDGVGLREIADAAGVKHGMIRYYYGTKDQLWRESVQHLFARIEQELAESGADRALADVPRFASFIRRYVHYCARHPEHARLMVQESTRDSERLAWAARAFIRPAHKSLLPTVGRLIATGDLPDVEPVRLIYLIVAAAQTPFLIGAEIRHTHGVDAFSPAEVDAHADAVARLFLGTAA